MKNKKTYLVTGASGFLGGALVRKFLQNGHRVVGVVRRSSGFLSKEELKHPDFSLLKLDLLNKMEGMVSKIDGVFHLAGQNPIAGKQLDFSRFLDGNVTTTRNVIDFAVAKEVKFFCFVSTGSVFGKKPKEKVITEKEVPVPTDYYGLTKYIAERLCEISFKGSATKTIVIRFPNLFGMPLKSGLLFDIFNSAKHNDRIELFSKGERYRTFLFRESAVQALVQIIDKYQELEPFEIFMAASAQSLKMKEIAQSIKRLVKSDSKIELVDRNPRYDWDVFIDTKRIQEQLGFKAPSLEKEFQLFYKELQS